MLKRGVLKRKPFKRAVSSEKLKVRRKTKRGKIKALWGVYGLTVPLYRRYTGRKGIYWYLFSKAIRKRDYEQNEGKCMTCNSYVEKGSDQCGHLFAARDCGFNLLFHPMNNHLQHSKCNNPRFTPSAGVHNSITIGRRYGLKLMDELAAIKKQKAKEWSQSEYDSNIKKLLRGQLP